MWCEAGTVVIGGARVGRPGPLTETITITITINDLIRYSIKQYVSVAVRSGSLTAGGPPALPTVKLNKYFR